MTFEPTPIEGAWVVTPELHEDERGFFARTWDASAFRARGLADRVAQCSVSFNHARGTLRGLHYQAPPHEEAKLVRCTAGVLFDVAVDLRPGSRSHRRWFGVELSAENRRAFYVPEGCAHGFLTLADGTEILYQISEFHEPAAARGVRYNDPAFAIDWPGEVLVVNERDRAFPDWTGAS
jgi:dTDP-4-dehydrorhamnose 3,5-epimerase